MLASIDLFSASLNVFKFLSFMQRTFDRLQPSTGILIYENIMAADYGNQLMESNPKITWCCFHNQPNKSPILKKSLKLINTHEEHILLITLLNVTELKKYFKDTFDWNFAPACKRMFILLENPLDNSYDTDKEFNSGIRLSHRNGVLVLLHKEPITIAVWNGFDITVTKESGCFNLRLLTESEFYAPGSRSAAIYINRLKHLDQNVQISLQVWEDPPSVMVVSDSMGKNQRILGADVDLFRLFAQKLNASSKFFKDDNVWYRYNTSTEQSLGPQVGPLVMRSQRRQHEFLDGSGSNNEHVVTMTFVAQHSLRTMQWFQRTAYKLLLPNNEAIILTNYINIERQLRFLSGWLLTTFLFTGLRFTFRRVFRISGDSRSVSDFQMCLFDTFARTLGKKATTTVEWSPFENHLLIVLDVFALLSSAMLSGTMFGLMMAAKPMYRINSIADFFCVGGFRVNLSFDLTFTMLSQWLFEQNVTLIPAFPAQVVKELLGPQTTSDAFVLRESFVIDIMSSDRARHPNGTARYRIVKEDFGMIFQMTLLQL